MADGGDDAADEKRSHKRGRSYEEKTEGYRNPSVNVDDSTETPDEMLMGQGKNKRPKQKKKNQPNRKKRRSPSPPPFNFDDDNYRSSSSSSSSSSPPPSPRSNESKRPSPSPRVSDINRDDLDDEYRPVSLKVADFDLLNRLEEEKPPNPKYKNRCIFCSISSRDIKEVPLLASIQKAWIEGIKDGVSPGILGASIQQMYNTEVRPLLEGVDNEGTELNSIPWSVETIIKHFSEHVKESNTINSIIRSKCLDILNVAADGILEENPITGQRKTALGAPRDFNIFKESVKLVLSLEQHNKNMSHYHK